jgi:hypothetical protein
MKKDASGDDVDFDVSLSPDSHPGIILFFSVRCHPASATSDGRPGIIRS